MKLKYVVPFGLAAAAAIAVPSYYLGARSEIKMPRSVKTLKLAENYEAIKVGEYCVGLTETDELKVVKLVNGRNPFLLSKVNRFDADQNLIEETELMQVSGLEVVLNQTPNPTTFTARKK